MASQADMRLWDLGPSDHSEVQVLAESCEDYYLETEGRRPGPADVSSILAELPPGSHERDKHVFGVRDEDGTLAADADAAGAKRLRVGVLGERAAAVRFWERQGFEVVDTLSRETDSGARELLVLTRELGAPEESS